MSSIEFYFVYPVKTEKHTTTFEVIPAELTEKNDDDDEALLEQVLLTGKKFNLLIISDFRIASVKSIIDDFLYDNLYPKDVEKINKFCGGEYVFCGDKRQKDRILNKGNLFYLCRFGYRLNTMEIM